MLVALTDHALIRMSERHVSESEILETIQRGEFRYRSKSQFYVRALFEDRMLVLIVKIEKFCNTVFVETAYWKNTNVFLELDASNIACDIFQRIWTGSDRDKQKKAREARAEEKKTRKEEKAERHQKLLEEIRIRLEGERELIQEMLKRPHLSEGETSRLRRLKEKERKRKYKKRKKAREQRSAKAA